MKHSLIVAGGAAASSRRLEAARNRRNGLEIRTIAQVAQRLAGGFLRLVDGDSLARAADEAIRSATSEELGDLQAIAGLPGLPGALAATLEKAWLADIDLAAEAAARPGVIRLATIARLERSVLGRLPPGMLRPGDLARRALDRLEHAPAVLGPIALDYLLDVAPCWRTLLMGLQQPSLAWRGGDHATPHWWAGRPETQDEPCQPVIRSVTCATARHEVIEAMRWARGLLATGNVRAGEIAFAAASPGEYDDLILAIGREASLDIHFAHGRRALTTRDGQAAAALADILLHGLSQDRVRRLARLSHAIGTPFGDLPEGWQRGLPRGAPLSSPERWRLGATLPAEVTAILLPAIDLLAQGTASAAAAGERILRGAALQIWRRALLRAPATALASSLAALRVQDKTEAATSIAWMHAAALACAPRSHVWLFGLNARTWPRGAAEDPLLPDHVIPSSRLEPMSIEQADRLAFHAIRRTTEGQVVCCASRRDATGRPLGLSPLMPVVPPPERLRRARVPEHAMSEQDRMMARPAEFAGTVRAASAHACWQDWNDPSVTPHDGDVRRSDHSVLVRALDRVHSATSLRLLLRNPLGFTWQYALGWREPDVGAEALALDALHFGNLVHGVLDRALPAIEAAGGLARAGGQAIGDAVADARVVVAAEWEAEAPVPPAILWALTLDRAEAMAIAALTWSLDALAGGRSYGEVAFGGMEAINADGPWDAALPVTIPGTSLRIRGRIDRLDLSGDGRTARLVDYKTGRPKDPGVLNGGSELQRCLYAYVVRALLGPQVGVEAALLFPGEAGAYHPLANCAAALATLTGALLRATASLREGRALFGPDTGGVYDAMAFALPASPGALTERKREAARVRLGEAALIWEEA